MSGQGHSHLAFGEAEIRVEVRAVNNRHLKLSLRTSEGLGQLESRVESLVRSLVRRGSLQLSVVIVGGEQTESFQVEEKVVKGYVEQCNRIALAAGIQSHLGMADLLPLPGVISENRSTPAELSTELAEAVFDGIRQAIQSLNEMRRAEGSTMQSELIQQIERLRTQLVAIENRVPEVIEEFRTRLNSRIGKAMAEAEQQLDEKDLTREVLLMVDRSDVREELVRLESHLQQFLSMLEAEDSQGRKLDFLIQEMFREANTIGSKANDAPIAQAVVEVKSIIEQMRELVQNVE